MARIVLFSLVFAAISRPCMAQKNDSGAQTAAMNSPIVASQPMAIEEFKDSARIEFGPTQARLLRMEHKVTRTWISDPGIAEPVVVSAREILLLGRRPGFATITMWDEARNYKSIVLSVRPNCGPSVEPMRLLDDTIGRFLSSERLDSQVQALQLKPVNLEKKGIINVTGSLEPAVPRWCKFPPLK
jgi:Flp pilus assembly secretin CpaC